MLVGPHPSALFFEISESGHVDPLDQRVAVVPSSSNGQQDQVHVHFAAVDHFFREAALGPARGRGSSLIPCTGSAAVVTAVVFGLQMKKGAQHRSMNNVRGISSSQYARVSPIGSPWRDSLFSAGGVLDGEGRSASRRL